MSITRTQLKFESNFTQIPNEWLRDTRISRKAKGLMAELMSHSVGWKITIEGLVEHGVEGRDAIRAAVLELEKYGYLTKKRLRDESGKLQGSHYELSEPEPENPTSENPTSVQPISEERPTKKNKAFKEHQETQEEHSSSGVAIAPSRPEVDHLCILLADLIEANGSKRPQITKRWEQEARLLLDKDGYTTEQVEWMLRWSQNDSFWKTNVLSMPKLREKFDQLKLKARGATPRSATERMDSTLEMGRRLQEGLAS